MKGKLLLMDISCRNNTSGVDRYMEVLLQGLLEREAYEIVRLHLLHDTRMVAHRMEVHTARYTEILLPMPENADPMIGKQYWSECFYGLVLEIFEQYGFGPDIGLIHLHTLNLIDLATRIRAKYGCPIITHLHCIPWKGILNHDKNIFNRLYAAYYRTHAQDAEKYLTNNGNEIRAYREADRVICLTRCAKEFLHRVANVSSTVALIPNGLQDLSAGSLPEGGHRIRNYGFRLLYVGGFTKSKGIFALLASLDRLWRRGFCFELTAAGFVEERVKEEILHRYPELTLHLPGVVDVETLQRYYREADIGIILSLQEQSSYVAIEMARAGLPLITTAVDGLDEMFETEVTALKVPVLFDPYRGLRVDEAFLDRSIIRLAIDQPLRRTLSEQIRRYYLANHTVDRMVAETVAIYKELTESEPSHGINDLK